MVEEIEQQLYDDESWLDEVYQQDWNEYDDQYPFDHDDEFTLLYEGKNADRNPIIRIMYEFLKDCSSSNPAFAWGALLVLVVLLELLYICLNSIDGPNYSTSSKYPFLPTAEQYWEIYLAYNIPLLFDATVRLFLIIYVVLGEENKFLFERLKDDPFTQCLFAFDIISVIPFIINVSYIKPQAIMLTETPRIVLRSMELLSTGRILRFVQDAPSVWTIRMALGRSFPALFVPYFFFLICLVFLANLLYFVEPCYDSTSCAWRDLVDASFFVSSSLTMTGYGNNQVPKFEYARFITALIMLSGAFFLSMPLAIIGSEYADACLELAGKQKKKGSSSISPHDTDLFGRFNAPASIPTTSLPADALKQPDANPSLSESQQSLHAPNERELSRQKVSHELIGAIHSSAVVESHTHLTEAANNLQLECDATSRITPTVLELLYNMDTWIGPFLDKLEADIRACSASSVHEQEKEFFNMQAFGSIDASKKLSAFHAAANKMLGIEKDAFSIEPVDLTNQSVHDILENAKAELLNPHHPKSFRGRIWMFLHVPSSSRSAWVARCILLVFITVSLVLLYTETIPQLTPFGESSNYCGDILSVYCADKSPDTDPGCYVQSVSGSTNTPLKFSCTSSECFAYGRNFGSRSSALSCGNKVLPFQSTADLYYHYGQPSMFTTRQKMQKMSAICSRLQCTVHTGDIFDTSSYWYYTEFIISVYFSIELLLRMWVASSLRDYCRNFINWFDILAVVPFFAEIAYAGGTPLIDFAVSSSAHLPVFLMIAKSFKAARFLKVTRYLHASKVLYETLKRILGQIAGLAGFLMFVVILFAVVFYEVESGRECFVGDAGCSTPSSVRGIVHTNERIMIDEKGEMSKFNNVFVGIWFVLVTISSTGSGGIVPITYGGRIINMALMVLTIVYLSIPITIAASTFYQIKEKFSDEEHRALIGERSKKSRQKASENRSLARLRTATGGIEEFRAQLTKFLQLLHKRPSPENVQRIAFLPLEQDKSWLLGQASQLASSLKRTMLLCRRDVLTLRMTLEKRKMDLKNFS